MNCTRTRPYAAFALAAAALLLGSAAAAPATDGPVWLPWPAQREPLGTLRTPAARDADAHVPWSKPNWFYGDKYHFDREEITAHESTHAVNAAAAAENSGWECFHLGGNRVLACGRIRGGVEAVSERVPRAWRGPRWRLYFIEQPARQEPGVVLPPLYVWNEWSAYCASARCWHEQGRPRTDDGEAPLEFIPYGLAVAEVYPLSIRQRHALRELLKAACRDGDRGGPTARRLRGPEGKQVREQARRLAGLDLAELLT
jgi:hypothetical protein